MLPASQVAMAFKAVSSMWNRPSLTINLYSPAISFWVHEIGFANAKNGINYNLAQAEVNYSFANSSYDVAYHRLRICATENKETVESLNP